MPRSLGMHTEDIKAAVRKNCGSLQSLAESNGYHRSAVSVALQKPWAEVEALIAAAIGKPAKNIWPTRYLPDGTPRTVRNIKPKLSSHTISQKKPSNMYLPLVA